MNLTPILSLIIGALGGVLVSGTAAFIAYRKLQPEIRHINADASRGEAAAAQSLIDAAKSLIEPYQDQINQLRTELTMMRQSNQRMHHRIDILEAHVSALEIVVRDHGGTPPPRPLLGGMHDE